MRREDIEFKSEGVTVRGWLYRPDGGSGDCPAVVLAGGWCYVRELVMPYYAESFANAGIAALVFDYRNLGLSDGEPRQHLDPWAQIRDYQSALSFLERCLLRALATQASARGHRHPRRGRPPKVCDGSPTGLDREAAGRRRSTAPRRTMRCFTL